MKIQKFKYINLIGAALFSLSSLAYAETNSQQGWQEDQRGRQDQQRSRQDQRGRQDQRSRQDQRKVKPYSCQSTALALLTAAEDSHDMGLDSLPLYRDSAEYHFKDSVRNAYKILALKDCVSAKTHDDAFDLYVSGRHYLRVLGVTGHKY